MSLRIFASLLLLFLFIEGNIVLGASTSNEAKAQYEAYKKEAESYCDSNDRSWKGWNTLIPKIDYPELEASAINKAMATWKADTRVIGDEKARLEADLNPSLIGEYTGFKALEVARIGYRSRMNSLFACAVVASRIDTLTDLQKNIEKKVKSKNSEVLQKLKNDAQKLNQTYNTLKCNVPKGSDGSKEEMITGLTNTSARQYCHYRHYLGYLETRINTNLTEIQNIEKAVGQGSGTSISQTTGQWNASFMKYKIDLEKEIIRADTTLPKALTSFGEMDQTYGVHIMLTIIYDDYTRLRSALSEYMNLNSQIYQKAHNAQNPNKS
ncbi:hypothetical protein HOO68_00800 [Candidatus Gracilibacteria bacterium]|nr:hypothetical protein [Candidatus Gracilibacteria bacterium]